MFLPIVWMWKLRPQGHSLVTAVRAQPQPPARLCGGSLGTFFSFLREAYASLDTMVYLSLHLRREGAARVQLVSKQDIVCHVLAAL